MARYRKSVKQMQIFRRNTILIKNKDIDKFLQKHPKRFPNDCSSCEAWYDLAKKEGKDILYDIYTGDIIGCIDATRILSSGKTLNLLMKMR